MPSPSSVRSQEHTRRSAQGLGQHDKWEAEDVEESQGSEGDRGSKLLDVELVAARHHGSCFLFSA